jgi:hypothetical protein
MFSSHIADLVPGKPLTLGGVSLARRLHFPGVWAEISRRWTGCVVGGGDLL